MLEPTLLDARLEPGPLPPRLPPPPYAVALHVDLEIGGTAVPAIVLGATGRLAAATLYARVERDDAGLPRLGAWEPAPELAEEIDRVTRA